MWIVRESAGSSMMRARSPLASTRRRLPAGRQSWAVLGLVSWNANRREDEGVRIPGFEPLATFLREQPGYRRLATVQPQHADVSLVSAGSHFGGADLLDEQLADYNRSHGRAWDLGVTLGLWDQLGLLPQAPR
jgi:hypothetical protein